jgi:hypothetical protein
MKLKDILAISGKSGLFKFVSQGRNGIIIESFEDQKRTVAPSSAKVSALDDIAIFTDTEEVPLAAIFRKIFEKEAGKECISHKSDDKIIKAYFAELLPEYDRNRVYTSDMKKVYHWYNTLVKLNMIDLDVEEENTAEAAEDGATTKDEATKEKTPKEKSTKEKIAKKTVQARPSSGKTKGAQGNIKPTATRKTGGA